MFLLMTALITGATDTNWGKQLIPSTITGNITKPDQVFMDL
jgi:hypothetical protein